MMIQSLSRSPPLSLSPSHFVLCTYLAQTLCVSTPPSNPSTLSARLPYLSLSIDHHALYCLQPSPGSCCCPFLIPLKGNQGSIYLVVRGLCLYPHSVELQHSIAFIHEEQMPLSGMDPLISCLAMLLRFVPVV